MRALHHGAEAPPYPASGDGDARQHAWSAWVDPFSHSLAAIGAELAAIDRATRCETAAACELAIDALAQLHDPSVDADRDAREFCR